MAEKHPRDRQRGRVYSWEQLYVYSPWRNNTQLTRPEIEQLIQKVWKRVVHDNNPPTFKFSPRLRHNAGWATATNIALNPDYPLRSIVLHEIAHSILDKLFHKKFAWHGSTFLALYIQLLVKESGFKKRPLIRGAREWGLIVKDNKSLHQLMDG